MSKTNNKMNHTKGYLRLNKHSKTNVEIDLDGVIRSVASTGGYQSNVDSERIYNENIANAARLVKCWNEYDELIGATRLLIISLEEQYLRHGRFIAPSQIEMAYFNAKNIIKQSEQG